MIKVSGGEGGGINSLAPRTHTCTPTRDYISMILDKLYRKFKILLYNLTFVSVCQYSISWDEMLII